MSKYSVYKLIQDKSKMSHIRLASDMTEELSERLYFDTSSKISKITDEENFNRGMWEDIEFELIPQQDQGYTDFLYFNDSVIIFSERIHQIELVFLCFYYSGEIIELKVKNSTHKYFLANVTNGIIMLDKKNCVFGPKDIKGQCDIIKYEFIKERTFSHRPLFKLDVDWSRCIYTLKSPKGEIEPDFFRAIKKHKIDIFTFKKLYGFDQYGWEDLILPS